MPSSAAAADGRSPRRHPRRPPPVEDEPDAIAAASEEGAFVPGDDELPVDETEEDATEEEAMEAADPLGLKPLVAEDEAEEDAEDESVEALPETPPPPPPTPLQAFRSELGVLQQQMGAADFPAAARLLSRYCLNAAEVPPEPKYRRIKKTNAVFKRVLAPHAAAEACLAAMGFVEGTDQEGNAMLVLGSAEPEVLKAAGDACVARIELLEKWPELLRASLPAACDALEEDAPETLASLTKELSAFHIPQLLGHEDNAERVAAQLRSPDAAARLVDQLVELRQNLTDTAAAQQAEAVSGSADGAAVGPSRVKRCSTQEEWYDALLEAKGLVVVDFGAEWCKPCQHVKPLFEALSANSAYKSVTFLSIDADENPVIVGENSISAFPTFKFFLNSAEEDLPIVGAEISDVQSKIDELMEANGLS